MAYKLMKRLITAAITDGTIEEKRADYLDKLDAFLAADRITTAQYTELVELIGGTNNAE